jgi:hypothetical protein
MGPMRSIFLQTCSLRAIENATWSVVNHILSEENMWFFIPEDEIRPTMEAYVKWAKEFKLDDKSLLRVRLLCNIVIYLQFIYIHLVLASNF